LFEKALIFSEDTDLLVRRRILSINLFWIKRLYSNYEFKVVVLNLVFKLNYELNIGVIEATIKCWLWYISLTTIIIVIIIWLASIIYKRFSSFLIDLKFNSRVVAR